MTASVRNNPPYMVNCQVMFFFGGGGCPGSHGPASSVSTCRVRDPPASFGRSGFGAPCGSSNSTARQNRRSPTASVRASSM